MRETFSTLLLTAQNYVVDPETSSKTSLSDTRTFLKKEINNAVREIHAALRNYKTQGPPKTASTVDAQQYYHYPAGVGILESVTIEVGDIHYPMQVVNNITNWEYLNQVDYSGSSIPQFIFPRRDDFGVWPIPQADGDTITFNSNPTPKDMTADDYTTGTVVIANGSQTVTGTDTTFTAAMVGRWLKADDDGDWYRISAFTSTTVITLETAFGGTSVASGTFRIGQSPEVPTELHHLIPHYAAAPYLAGPRRSPDQAQKELNFFYTGDYTNFSRKPSEVRGGLIKAVGRYNSLGRSNSQLVRRNSNISGPYDETWSATLS